MFKLAKQLRNNLDNNQCETLVFSAINDGTVDEGGNDTGKTCFLSIKINR